MKISCKILIALFSITTVAASSQNLVQNGGFESFSSCPNTVPGWNYCTGWNNVNMSTGVGLWGTPDYYNRCGTANNAPPSVYGGTCMPHTGNSMMGLVEYNAGYANYREYLASQLVCPMIIGNTYTVSFWLTNGTGIISPWVIKNFGVHLSVGALSQSGYAPINVIPQAEITTSIASTTWVNYTFTVMATAAWNYITIGSFRTDQANSPYIYYPNPGGPYSSYANYFLDDVAVFGLGSGQGTVSITSSNIQPTICAGQQVTLTAQGGNNYSWNTGATTSSIVITPTATTGYSVTTGAGSCGSSTSIVVQVTPPSSTISVTSDGGYRTCLGQTLNLTANGMQSYTWSTGSNSTSIAVSPTTLTNYTVTGSAANGCLSSTVITVQYAGAPSPISLSITPIGTVCVGSKVILKATGVNSFTWSNGATTGSIPIVPQQATTLTVIGTATNGCQSTASTTILVKVCDNVAQIENENNIMFYPQPFVEDFTVSGRSLERASSIRIMDVAGKVVFYQSGQFNGELKIDLSTQPDGLYILTLSGQDGQYSTRICKRQK